jgi:hypothetical protein
VNILDSDPAVATGALNENSEHLKSPNWASQFATNKFFLDLLGKLTALTVEVELVV